MLGFDFWAWRILFRYDMYDCMIHKIGHPSSSCLPCPLLAFLFVRSNHKLYAADLGQPLWRISILFYTSLVFHFHFIFTFRTRGGNGIKDTCVLASNGSPCNSSLRYFGSIQALSKLCNRAWKWRLLGSGGLASASRAGEILTLGTLVSFYFV